MSLSCLCGPTKKKRKENYDFASATSYAKILGHFALIWQIITQDHLNHYARVSCCINWLVTFIQSQYSVRLLVAPDVFFFFQLYVFEKWLSVKWILSGLQQVLCSSVVAARNTPKIGHFQEWPGQKARGSCGRSTVRAHFYFYVRRRKWRWLRAAQKFERLVKFSSVFGKLLTNLPS